MLSTTLSPQLAANIPSDALSKVSSAAAANVLDVITQNPSTVSVDGVTDTHPGDVSVCAKCSLLADKVIILSAKPVINLHWYNLHFDFHWHNLLFNFHWYNLLFNLHWQNLLSKFHWQNLLFNFIDITYCLLFIGKICYIIIDITCNLIIDETFYLIIYITFFIIMHVKHWIRAIAYIYIMVIRWHSIRLTIAYIYIMVIRWHSIRLTIAYIYIMVIRWHKY